MNGITFKNLGSLSLTSNAGCNLTSQQNSAGILRAVARVLFAQNFYLRLFCYDKTF